ATGAPRRRREERRDLLHPDGRGCRGPAQVHRRERAGREESRHLEPPPRRRWYRKPMGTTTLLSFEEFERLPDEPGKLELLDGELIQLPPAKRKHVDIAHRIYDLL